MITEVAKDTPLTSLILGCSLAAHTVSSTRRVTGALLATMRVA